jgi:hypothetical protein
MKRIIAEETTDLEVMNLLVNALTAELTQTADEDVAVRQRTVIMANIEIVACDSRC